jgi:prepilin-type processing-associated H-X9-DG protein/prepilin-type N-terminal cleavage/methylation domain-containing protein
VRPAIRRLGFNLIELIVVIAIITVALGLLLSAVQKARDTAARIQCANNLHQTAIGLHAFHDAHGGFPAGWNNWLPQSNHDYKFWQLSWLATMLPFVEQESLWRQTVEMEIIGSSPAPCLSVWPSPYKWSNPWDACTDGAQRYQALETVVRIYSCPADSRTLQANSAQGLLVATTSYLGVSGPDIYAWSVNSLPAASDSLQGGPGVFTGTNKYDFRTLMAEITVSSSGRRLADISDGTSTTLMIGERPPPSTFDYGWWFAGYGQRGTGSLDALLGTNEINLQNSSHPDVNACPAGPYAFSRGSLSNVCDVFHFWSLHSGGANFAFADGSVKFLTYEASAIMRPLSTIAGREIVTVP